MKGVVIRMGGVPVMYLPRFNRDLKSHDQFFIFVPGYSSRHGAFFLTSYHYKLTDRLKGITHVDPRSERGVGLGQDFEWKGGSTNRTWRGSVRAYYLNDPNPLVTAEEEEEYGDLVDGERYRLRLGHTQTLSARDTLYAEASYVSDPLVVEEFFYQEYRGHVQPENRITLSHRGEDYSAGLLVNKRINDFYGNIDRTPELSLDLHRQQIGDTPFYYESQNSAAYLEHVYPKGTNGAESADYDAFRVDSDHALYYPGKYFGFLNVTPRAGYRGTYYSETLVHQTVTNSLIITNSSGVVTSTNEVQTLSLRGGSGFRNVEELGFEASFKAYRTWDEYVVMNNGDGLRHVAEPYLLHTYIPEPNLLPAELLQFDKVDTLDLRHDVKIGMRNKLQTRLNGRICDLLDLDVYVKYYIEKPAEAEDFSNIFFDSSLRLVKWLPIDFDGQYNQYEGQVEVFNTQISCEMEDKSSLALEYRYKQDSRELVSAELSVFPQNRWSFQLTAQADLETSQMQEQSFLVQYKNRCMGKGIGIRQNGDSEIQIWIQVWLIAFPDTKIELGK